MIRRNCLSLQFGLSLLVLSFHGFHRREIADGGRPYEVLNTGIGNTNTAVQSAYFLNEGHRFKPDVVVLNYFIDDAQPTPARKENFLVENFYAAVFLAGRPDVFMRTCFGRGGWRSFW